MADQNPNSGSLFKETDKKNPKGPDFTGTVTVDGKKCRIVGWNRTAKESGREFISINIETPEQIAARGGKQPGGAASSPAPAAKAPVAAAAPAQASFEDEDVPF